MIVSTVNPKGGVGKSSTCINLAHHLNATLIIDQDNNASLSEANKLSDTPKNIVRANDIETIVSLVRNSEGVVMIDTGGYNSKLAQQILSISDVIVTPSGQSVLDLVGIKNLNAVLSNLSTPDHERKALVFPNNFHANKKNFTRLENCVNALSNLVYVPVSVHHNNKITNASDYAKSAFEVYGYDKAARQYKAIAEEVLKHG